MQSILARGLIFVCAVLMAPAPGRAQQCTHPAGNVSFGLFGDVNGSGARNVSDALCAVLAIQATQSSLPLSSVACLAAGAPLRADVNCSGTIDVTDVTAIIALALGLPVPPGLHPDATGCPAACASCAPPGLASCLIGGSCVPEGARAGAGECEVCAPASSATAWALETCQEWFRDEDDDGFGVSGDSQCTCVPAAPYTAEVGSDCDDGDDLVFPAAAEACDSVDNNCDGATDEGCASGADGLSCRAIFDDSPGAANGIYALDPDGSGPNEPFEAYCDVQGGGWTLALRASGASQFTFNSPYWTNAQTLNEGVAPTDPSHDGDAKFPAFNLAPGSQLRGCLRNLSTGVYTCRDYTLPEATTLRSLFANTPIGSDSNNNSGSIILGSGTTEMNAWLSMAGLSAANLSTTPCYMRAAINLDDDLSCYDARVRFGVGINNECDVYTLNDAVGFGASSYYSGECDLATSQDPPWSVGAGLAAGPVLHSTRGTIWVRSPATPVAGASCRQILETNPAAPSGWRWIDVDGSGPLLPAYVYCDMSTGFTFQPQGTVQNNAESILAGCSNGLEPFQVRSLQHAHALSNFVKSLGNDANAWYYANVFAGPHLGCPAVSGDFGWLSSPAQWNGAGVPNGTFLNTSNCNLDGFDPVPLNQQAGYAFRASTTVLYNSGELLHTGTMVCGLNDIPASATSCFSLKAADPSLPDGVYALTPLGAGTSSILAYCDMTTDGGGWTLIGQFRPSADSSLQLCVAGSVGAMTLNDDQVVAPAKLSNAQISGLFANGLSREVLMKSDENTYAGTVRSGAWPTVCLMNLSDTYSFHLGQHSMADLDSTLVQCSGPSGATSWNITSVPSAAGWDVCGWTFSNSADARHVIWSAPTTYNQPPCAGAVAGRTWAGTGPNQGCRTSKLFVR